MRGVKQKASLFPGNCYFCGVVVSPFKKKNSRTCSPRCRQRLSRGVRKGKNMGLFGDMVFSGLERIVGSNGKGQVIEEIEKYILEKVDDPLTFWTALLEVVLMRTNLARKRQDKAELVLVSRVEEDTADVPDRAA